MRKKEEQEVLKSGLEAEKYGEGKELTAGQEIPPKSPQRSGCELFLLESAFRTVIVAKYYNKTVFSRDMEEF